jgi:hypothetical protein
MGDVGDSFVRLLEWALTWWLAGDDPGLAALRRNVAAVAPVTRWITAVALAVGLLLAAVVVAARRRGGDLAEAVVGLGRFLLLLSAGWLLLAAGWSMSDGLARWIVGGRAGASEYVGSVRAALAAAEPTMARTMAVVGTAAVLGFVAMVMARVVLTVLIAVALPVLAAVGLRRPAPGMRVALAWVVAIIAFRPIAALVYRVSHDLVTASREPVVVLIVVCLTFLLSAALLPGVARALSPGRTA